MKDVSRSFENKCTFLKPTKDTWICVFVDSMDENIAIYASFNSQDYAEQHTLDRMV